MAPKAARRERQNAVSAAAKLSYTRKQTIAELDGFLNHGKRFFPIETAICALDYLERSLNPLAPDAAEDYADVCDKLRAWLHNEDPDLPVPLAEETLFWLRELKPIRGAV